MDVNNLNGDLWVKPGDIYEAINMIQKIKSLYPIAGILWVPADIIEYAITQGLPEVSEEDSIEVINLMEENADCNHGLMWDDIGWYLDVVVGSHEYDDGICPYCNGSGEGPVEGSVCHHCKGM